MSVGDIKRRHGVEECRETLDTLGIVDSPEGMSDSVVKRHIGDRHSRGGLSEQFRDGFVVDTHQEHRTGLCIQRLDLPDAVVFLVGTCEFMLADPIAVVGSDRGSSHQSELGVFAHRQTIRVIAWMRVAAENAAINQALKVLGRPGIYFGRKVIDVRRKINLGLGDMQEGQRLAVRRSARFFTGKHIIGGCSNGRSILAARAKAGKRLNQTMIERQ